MDVPGKCSTKQLFYSIYKIIHDFSIPQDCVRAMGKTWHSKCFGCEICGLNFSIAQCGFHENEGRALCESCYANNILPKCQACQKPITDRTMKAMGGQWHVSCFVCKVGLLWYHQLLKFKPGSGEFFFLKKYRKTGKGS